MNSSDFILALLLVFGITGKGISQTHGVEGGESQSYPCSGVVQQVIPGQSQIIIHHKAIPDFMSEMTMNFNVKDTNELKGIAPRQEVQFSLRVLANDAWIENIRVMGYSEEPVISQGADSGPELKPGELWPDGEMLAEDGRKIHFSDFRGQVLAFNFFFSRCPLPNYCPLLNRNLAEARKLLSTGSGVQTNYFFLSVSFDPDSDTPAALAKYAVDYRTGRPHDWVFAAASKDLLANLPPALGLIVNRKGTGISHTLRTVVLDTQGRVYRQFDGNTWTAGELANAMKEASQPGIKKGPQ